ncbi:hypothetical protein EWM64_g2428 [Hericium alpestre]|uniref:Uncharacterized protein n=1 Tax=Hericium alpestre TaxID=135208 RepID=A0A4Z0A3I6_9AGAM|nr:hypothetical protein EWM64_g2428 [Hericium alpestre]
MPPTPLLPYHINLTLQYISPPSELDEPIPRHLLSTALFQRHHFLNISFHDSANYLCWAHVNRDHAIELLEALPTAIDDETLASFPIHYTSDAEHSYAHVHILPSGDHGLRLVFQWDGEESWRYHDANLMPFPPGSHASLDQALVGSDTDVATSTIATHHNSDGDHSDKGEDADYWNSYGAHDEDVSPRLSRNVASKAGSELGEDAYWAQYASVQGSADSTIPSPVQKVKRRLHPGPEHDHLHHIPTEEPLPIPPISFRPHLPASRDVAPCPHTLSHRLTALSPRHSRPSSRYGSRSESVVSDVASNRVSILQEWETAEAQALEESDSLSTAAQLYTKNVGDEHPSSNGQPEGREGEGKDILSPRPQKTHDVSFLQHGREQHAEVAMDGVNEAIRGVYRLWKASRRTGPVNEMDEFVCIVRDAIEEL